ncbi:hypothetical protein TIFTF001_027097 [Ficus carica]|uniref:Uncharacterized protein n=1 Tax=Ficus carica TaxID=3494 RepID=A0AA88IZS5_FICCA|nr:hypothetical protein TIFTF001_027097 [Ficus carica]
MTTIPIPVPKSDSDPIPKLDPDPILES